MASATPVTNCVCDAYLPAGAAVRVALVLEVRHILHHPLVDLAKCQPVVGRRADRLRD